MKITQKTKRCIGTTSRLIGNATVHNGLYIAPNTGVFLYAQSLLKKECLYSSIERLRTMRSLKLNLPKDKTTPLYFDEGCDLSEVVELEQAGYNIAEIVVGRYEEEVTFKKEYDCVFYHSNSIPSISKVVYDIPNGTTIVYFSDNTKEIARVFSDEFDKETGVLQCIAKKMYGSRSRWLKDVVNKGVEKKSK